MKRILSASFSLLLVTSALSQTPGEKIAQPPRSDYPVTQALKTFKVYFAAGGIERINAETLDVDLKGNFIYLRKGDELVAVFSSAQVHGVAEETFIAPEKLTDSK